MAEQLADICWLMKNRVQVTKSGQQQKTFRNFQQYNCSISAAGQQARKEKDTMYTHDSNFRTTDPTLTTQHSSQSNQYMSVAAKAGEMQIFSSDILSQVNGINRRQTAKNILKPMGKYSSSHINDNRLTHIQEQMNNVEERMLAIDSDVPRSNLNITNERGPLLGSTGEIQHSLKSQQNQRGEMQLIGKGNLQRDQMPSKQQLATLQGPAQRLHPTKTFGEYVASSNGMSTAKQRMTIQASGPGNSLQMMNGQQNKSLSEAVTIKGVSSNGQLSNSSSAIGQQQPAVSRYSEKDVNDNSRHNSPIIMRQISEKHLKIEVQSSQQARRGLDAPNVDTSFTPTMLRRSIPGRSGFKQQQQQQQPAAELSFLDKTQATVQNTTNADQSSFFDQRNPIGIVPSAVTVKKLQAAKLAQQQLLQNRYTNGTEQHMLPKMAGISLERKQTNGSRQHQNTSSLPPTGNSMQISLVQQNNIRRRHGEGSYGGQMNDRIKLGISGESLQIKLTGTSLMNNRNQQRDSLPQAQSRTKELLDNPSLQSNNNPTGSVYHPKLRARMPDIGPLYSSNPAQAVIGSQSQFAQQMVEMHLNSPRNGSQIFQDNPAGRVYNYHYIYDFLFVHVTEQQYEREYAHKIRTFNKHSSEESAENTSETGNCPNDYAQQPQQDYHQNDVESSPHTRRGPALKLNQNQVFFSPHVQRDSQGRIIDTGLHIDDQESMSRFKASPTEQMNSSEFGLSNNGILIEKKESQQQPRSKVVKMKKHSIKTAINQALQSTQFEGLKVLMKDNILQVQKDKKWHNSDEQPGQLQAEKEGTGQGSDEEIVSKFMSDVGQWLSDQNRRFKVTVKKKYINDILMQSKGAQNLAQHVVVVVTNNTAISFNQSPMKKPKRVKRNHSVDDGSSLGENDQEQQQATESQLRMHGQATPQVSSSKVKAQQIGRRGYESENEIKSFNSTTTSSTFPNLQKQGYATKQQNTPRQPRQMSNRSLSQIPNTVRVKRRVTEDINDQGVTAAAVSAADEALNSLGQRYPPTKIKIVQNVLKYNDHMDHNINKMLSDYNEFTRLVFRTRTSEATAMQNIPFAIKLGKRLGMQLTKNQLMPATLKVRENANAIKEKLIFHMCRVMCQENIFEPTSDQQKSIYKKQVSELSVRQMEQLEEQISNVDFTKMQGFHYKCYIGKGNNQMMVRALFKNRFWWLFHEKDEPEKVNFFWTQLRKLSIMNSLTCKFVNPKDKNQQKHLQQIVTQSPGQGLGFAIVQNGAMLTPTAANKFKKRKPSATQSKSPDPASTSSKQKVSESGDQHPNNLSNVPMTMIGRTGSETAVDETKIDIAPVTCAPPEKTIQSPNIKEEMKKESSEPAKNHNGRGKPFELYPVKLANKIEDNYHLCNKKALFVNMKNYYEAIGEDPFDSIPVTFHIKEGLEDPNYLQFKQYYDDHKENPNNIWITKPGECTNRGTGIQVAKEWSELQQIISDNTRSSKKTCIVQKYIHNPLLINRRKFDIRTYAMVTCQNGNYKAYYYNEGYLRTSCREFSLNNLSNRMVHLTNDAVQKKAEDYGKFEPGNKLSYQEFQNYIDKNHTSLNVCFERDILPQVRKLTTDCFRAAWGKMDPYKRFNTFEIYGLDFMIDEAFKVYLIEVNTNPCLELSSPLLARLIPSMVENALRLAVDPVFPPPEHFSQRKHIVHELCPENKFQLIFDERVDGPELCEIFREKDNIIIEIDEEELSDADIDGNKDQDGRDD